MIRQLLEAVPMDCMTTWQFMTGGSTREQILLTHGTITHVLPSHTIMIVEQLSVDAHSTVEAVSKILESPHATEPAVGTMIGSLIVGHP